MIERPRRLRYTSRDPGNPGPGAGSYLVSYHRRTRKPTGTAYLVIERRPSRKLPNTATLLVIRVPLEEAQRTRYWPLWWATRRKVGRRR